MYLYVIKRLIIFIIIIFIGILYPTGDTLAQSFFFTYTNATSGLINDNIQAFAVDPDGSIWIGTTGGLSKFDGNTWTNYTAIDGLIDNDVRGIAVDVFGDLWFATAAGVSKFDGTVWTNYTSVDGLTYDDVLSVAVDIDSSLWFGTSRQGQNGGVSNFDGAVWTSYKTNNSNLVDNQVNDIQIDSAGNKWFCTGGGVSKFDGAVFTNYTSQNSDLPNNKVQAAVFDDNGDIWFATNGGGLCTFDGAVWTTYTSQNSNLPNNKVHTVELDSCSNLWIGSTGGVSKFDGITWTNYTVAEGLTDNEILAICIDPIEEKWFGTAAGANRYKHYLELASVTASDSTFDAAGVSYTIQFTTNRPLFNTNEIAFSFPAGYTFSSPSVNLGLSTSPGAMPSVESSSSNQLTLSMPGYALSGLFSLVLTGVNNSNVVLRQDSIEVVIRKNNAADTLIYADYNPAKFNTVGRLVSTDADRPINTNSLSGLGGIGGNVLPMANLKLTATGEHSVLQAVQFTPVYIGMVDADVTNFDIYLDSDSDGFLDPGESSVALIPVDDVGSGNSININISDTVYTSSPKMYIITADFQNTIAYGDSARVEISACSTFVITGIVSGSAPNKTGASIIGYQHTTKDLSTNTFSVNMSNPGVSDTGSITIQFSIAQGLNNIGDEIVVVFPSCFDISNITLNPATSTLSGSDPVINAVESNGDSVVLDITAAENFGLHTIVFDNVINPDTAKDNCVIEFITRLDDNTVVDQADPSPSGFWVVGKLFLMEADNPIAANALGNVIRQGGTNIPVTSFKLNALGENSNLISIGVTPNFDGITSDELTKIDIYEDLDGNGQIDVGETSITGGTGDDNGSGNSVNIAVSGYTLLEDTVNFIVTVDLSSSVGVFDTLSVDVDEGGAISGIGSITSSQPVKSGNKITGFKHMVEGFEIIAPNDTTILEGREITVEPGYKSTISGSIFLSALNIPEYAEFNSSTGTFTWAPSFSQAGNYVIQFSGVLGSQVSTDNVSIYVREADLLTDLVEPDTTFVDKNYGAIPMVGSGGIYTKHRVYIPKGAMSVSRDVILKGADLPLSELEKSPSTFEAVIFNGIDDFEFDDYVYVTVEYKEFLVKNSESRMRVHEWDSDRSRWKIVRGEQTVNENENTVTARVNHFSIFSAIELSDTTNTVSIIPGWNMICTPLIPDQVTDPVAIFGDDIRPFRNETRNSSIYYYDEVNGNWSIPTEIEAGKGYILFAFSESDVDVDGLFDTSDITHELSYTNGNGWHLIGNPYSESIDFTQDITIDPGIYPTFYIWTGSQYEYYPGGGLTATINPWQGFWVRTTIDGAQLNITYPGSSSKHAGDISIIDWRIQIKAKSGDVQDSHNYFGMSEQAENEYDINDIYELVPLNDEFISVYFPHLEWNEQSGNFTQDIRKTSDEEMSWKMTVVTNNSTDYVSLKWLIPEGIITRYDIFINTESGESINMREQNEYRYSIVPENPKSSAPRLSISNDPGNFMSKLSDNGVAEKSFTIILKEAEESNSLVPDEYYLMQNYPNPFNSTTTIEYGLIQTGHVSLKIYNILGQEIRALVNSEQQAGIYKTPWDGKNNNGRDVSSGVYIYSISVKSFNQVRKLTLLR
ncbi:two-component regulator propeller domain-containing protein [candidate division KSB1 bacterium]